MKRNPIVGRLIAVAFWLVGFAPLIVLADVGQIIGVFNPPNSLKVDGNTSINNLDMPAHFQQLYDASLFSALPPGGATLGNILFRGDQGRGEFWQTILTGVEITVSVTSKNSATLSPNYAENITSTPFKVVLDKDRFFTYSGWSGGGTASTFGIEFGAGGSFFYDPSRGNLLIDVKGFQIPKQFGREQYIDGFNDSKISGVWSPAFGDVDPTRGQLVSGGYVTGFYFYSVPEPTPVAILFGFGGIIVSWTFVRKNWKENHVAH